MRQACRIAPLLITLFMPVCLASNSVLQIESALNEAKILGPSYRVTVADAGAEAIVSTYLNKQSRDADKDCKIDAVLLAKKVMELDGTKARVKVRFYDFDRKRYREVSVTTGDIAAFGSGNESKDRLLSSLAVNAHTVAAPQPATQTKSAQTAASQSSALAICRVGSIAFYHPKNWVRKNTVNALEGDDSDVLAQFIDTSSTQDATITIAHHKADSVSRKHSVDCSRWKHRGFLLMSPQRIRIGYRGSLEAISQIIAKPDSEGGWVERHVYFGYAPNIYSVTLDCPSKKSKPMDNQLNYFLSTMQLAQ